MKVNSIEFGELYKSDSRNGIWKTSAFIGKGTPYVKMNELFSKKFISSEGSYELIELEEREKDKLLLENEDLLFSRTSVVPEGVGKCSIICDLKGELAFDSNIIRVRLNNQLCNPKYIFYYFNSPFGRGQILSLANGAAVKTIKGSDLKNLKLSLLELPTQRKIASILSAYDDLIENNLKRIKLLEEKAFLRYKLIVKSEKFQKVSVFEYAEIMSGGTPSTTNHNYWEGEIPFFTPKDLSMQSGYYLNDTERKITELGLEKCNSRLFPRDTIFITARGTVGKLVLAKIPSAISQSNYAITTRNGSSNYFLFLALIDKINHFKQLAVGGVFDTIIVDTFKMIFIELPKEETINQFNIEIKPIFQLIDILQKQNTKLREARDILLPRLMNGQIEV